jgi:S1-C subfamily serine protease
VSDRNPDERSIRERLERYRSTGAARAPERFEPPTPGDPTPAPIPDDVTVSTASVMTATAAPAAPPVWDPRTGTFGTSEAPSVEKKTPQSRSTVRAALAGGLVGAIVAAAVAIPVARMAAPDGGTTTIERRISSDLPAVQGRSTSIADIASKARPWVVNIDVSSSQQTLLGSAEVSGTGSGIILRSDGHIITNAHVVEDAQKITVTLASGDAVQGRLIGADPETDVAVVKVGRNDLPAAVVGSVKDIVVGDTAVAIGSPLGLEQSVTAGIISALGRRVDRPNQSPLFDMIQTDAPVTQGNSGGALIDAAGAVVGVNSAIAASPEVGAEGIAFAIPIDVAVAVAEELINSGRATHPWLGVTGGNITPEAAEQFGVEEGAFIREVVSGGPADKAGMRANDVVVEFAGEPIESMDDLVVAIREHKVGEAVKLVVFRDGKRVDITATLGDKP